MQLIHDVKDMQRNSLTVLSEGKRIALVPTMGYLHDGHVSLLKEGRRRADHLIASIFVNPAQFAAGEDLEKYPRDLERDLAICEQAGVDTVFAPAVAEMYPPGFQTYVTVETVSLPLCGASRPGHFRGVTTVVAKLFAITQASVALFGRKDYQQLAVICQMVKDLNIPIEIVGMPIVREHDGLAMSSRNAYLSSTERSSALCIKAAIDHVRQLYRSGVRSADALHEAAQNVIRAVTEARIDYIAFCDGTTLQQVDTADDATLMAVAVFIGKTRLIDNSFLGDSQQ